MSTTAETLGCWPASPGLLTEPQAAAERTFPPSVFPEAGGGTWIMGQRSVLWHIGLSGQVRSFPIPTRWFYPKRTPQTGNDYYLTTLSVVDGLGRRWFWSDALAGDSDFACLHGALVWDGKTLTSHPALPGVPDKPFSVIAPQDAGHLWVAVNNAGLYSVDTRTGQSRHVPPPEHGAFLNIEQMFRAQGNWYLTDWASTPDERSVVLWRQKAAGGQWEKRVPGLDKSADSSSLQQRSWLVDPAGLWLGAFGGGAWRLPANGRATPVDWRRSFPVPFVNRLFRLPDGRLLAIGYNVSMAFPPRLPPLLPNPGFPVRTFLINPNFGDLSADASRHLWGLLATDTRRLSEWDGAAWRKHSVPKKIALDKLAFSAWDTQERVWLLPNDHTGPAAIFNPKTSAWTAFASCEAAYATQAGLAGFALRTGSGQPMPRFGSGGRVCFLSGEYFVHFFDGRRWQQWKVGSIVGGTGDASDCAVSDGPPFFNRAGFLCLNWVKKSFVWTPSTGWHSAIYEVGPDDDSARVQNSPPALPPGSPTPRPDLVVLDGPETAWLTYHQQLYKVAFGLVAPQFPPGTAQPFLDGRSILSVLHDSRDNLFFSTGGEYVVLPALPAPQTRLAAALVGTDTVRLTLTASGAGRRWFVWRLDGGAWSAATRQENVRLDFLPGGPHTAEAMALDERLRFNPIPARVAFTIHADPKKQVQALIDMLTAGPDTAREAAVAGLRKQPDAALSALKAARPAASDLGKWWIDATIQQIGAGETPKVSN